MHINTLNTHMKIAIYSGEENQIIILDVILYIYKIRLIWDTHEEKTLQRQLEQSHIGNLDHAKPYN